MESYCYNHPRINAMNLCTNCRQSICQTCSQGYRNPFFFRKLSTTQYYCPNCYIQKVKPLLFSQLPFILLLSTGISWLFFILGKTEMQTFFFTLSLVMSIITALFSLLLPLASKYLRKVSKIPQLKEIVKRSDIKIDTKF